MTETKEETVEMYAGENDRQFFDTDSILVVANKKHALPAGYEPSDLVHPNVEMLNDCYLRSLAAAALEEMFAAADAEGVHLVLSCTAIWRKMLCASASRCRTAAQLVSRCLQVNLNLPGGRAIKLRPA